HRDPMWKCAAEVWHSERAGDEFAKFKRGGCSVCAARVTYQCGEVVSDVVGAAPRRHHHDIVRGSTRGPPAGSSSRVSGRADVGHWLAATWRVECDGDDAAQAFEQRKRCSRGGRAELIHVAWNGKCDAHRGDQGWSARWKMRSIGTHF